jgi:hypothetical protein
VVVDLVEMGGPSSGNDGLGGGEPGGEMRHLRSSHRTESPSRRGRTGGPRDELCGKYAVKYRAIETGEPELSDRSGEQRSNQIKSCTLLTISMASPERTHHGVHPDDWEVASSFSTVIDDESVRTRNRSVNSVRRPNKSDSEGGLCEFVPNTHAQSILLTVPRNSATS